MSDADEHKSLPAQKEGSSSDTVAQQQFDSTAEAARFYQVVKSRLLDVNNWQQHAGSGTAQFQLTDAAGAPVSRPVEEKDYFKIDIPGPGSRTGDGFDWVQVASVSELHKDDQEELRIEVHPASNPTNSRTDVAHFFSAEATSCFIAKRVDKTVFAEVHGRNEKPNTEAETLVDKARNVLMASGAVAAFSKIQWKLLVDGLVKRND